MPLLALLPRRLTDDEVDAICAVLTRRRQRVADAVDIGAEITRVTDVLPSPVDTKRVQQRLIQRRRPTSGR